MVKRKANSNILMISLIIVGCIIYFFQLIYSPGTLVGEQGLRQAKLCLVISLIWHLIVGVIIGYYIPFALMLYFNTNDKLMKHSKKIIAISVIAFIIAFTFIGKSNYFRWYSEPFSSGKSSVAQDFRMLRNVILDQINEETIEVPVNTYKIVKGIITFRKRRRHTHKSTYYIEVNDGQFMIPVSEEDINLLKAYMLKGTNLLTLYKNSGFLVAINGKNEPVSYLEAEIEDILKNYYSSFINLTIDSNGIAHVRRAPMNLLR